MQNTHKKICIVSICLAKGGAERSAAMLSEMLHDHGHEVHTAILTNEIKFSFKGTLFNLGLQKKDGETWSGRFKRLLKLRAYLKEQQFDVIVDHRTKNEYYRELFYHNVIYRGFQKIYVVHSSNTDLYLTKQPKNFAKIYNQNKATVGVSSYISQLLKSKYGILNAHTIHNTFNTQWEQTEDKLPKILQNKQYILSYGRINDSVKDLSFLLNSFTASNLWKQDVKLVILGDGEDKDTLQAFASRLPAVEHIIFLPNQVPFAIVANAQCVTLTSKFEGFPMVLVEALSLGTPVVSLDIVSGPSEIVQHRKNGLLIPKREVSLFAEALRELLLDDVLRAYCKEHAKASVEKFSMHETAKKWHQIIQDEVH